MKTETNMKFRKKPVVIEATQWNKMGDHENVVAIPQSVLEREMKEGIFVSQRGVHPDVCGWIGTLEGGHIVFPSDWIITGVQGEQYPCKPDIFEATYESESTPSHSEETETTENTGKHITYTPCLGDYGLGFAEVKMIGDAAGMWVSKSDYSTLKSLVEDYARVHQILYGQITELNTTVEVLTGDPDSLQALYFVQKQNNKALQTLLDKSKADNEAKEKRIQELEERIRQMDFHFEEERKGFRRTIESLAHQ